MDAIDNNEAARLEAVTRLDLDNNRVEPELVAIAALAATLTGCPMAAVSIVGEATVWAKAARGLTMLIAPRANSFTEVVIASGATLIVPDAPADPRFAPHVTVTGTETIRAGAGVPITVLEPDGARLSIGALIVMDRVARPFDAEQCIALELLREVTDALIAARLVARNAQSAARQSEAASRRLRRQDRTFRQAERVARIGSWRYRLDDAQLEWSDEVYRIHGLEPGAAPPVRRALDFYPPHARAQASQALAATLEHGTAFDVEADFVTAKGELRRVRSMGELEMENGRPVAIIGVVQDVTERYRLEQNLRISANSDEVTGIANRTSFNRTLESSMIRAGEKGLPLMLALIDLDHFKAINDTYGHIAGDEVLRAVGARLREPWLADSFAARLGGDEFALIVEDPGLLVDPAAFARRLTAALDAPVLTSAGEIPVSGTVGTSLLSDDIEAMRDLMHAADTALYDGKRRRRGTIMLVDERRAANG